MAQQTGLHLNEAVEEGPVECLGRTFGSEEERRAYFLERLREKLKDPEFRRTPGFPRATDEDILRLSDPPYYTACPNPFLADFLERHADAFNPPDGYHREPLALDVSEGKGDALYNAHAYHTKVPYLAIVPFILHYTKPGDVVLDGFCGSGMTGVAAQWCEVASFDYKRLIEERWLGRGFSGPDWGLRYAIIGDLSPAATAIAAGFNLPLQLSSFEQAAKEHLNRVADELSWMYLTSDPDSNQEARILNTVWSEILICPVCSGFVEFVANALDPATRKSKPTLACPECGAEVKRRELERKLETAIDGMTGQPRQRVPLVPILINYRYNSQKREKSPSQHDLNILESAAEQALPIEIPVNPFPFSEMWEAPRLRTRGITAVHHLFFPRTLHVLGRLWREAETIEDARVRNALKFWIDSQFSNLSLMNRYRPTVSFPYNPLPGTYYIASAIMEANPFIAYENKLLRISAAVRAFQSVAAGAWITTGDAARIPIPGDSIDYVFTDPPFGDNYAYSELNFVAEAWHRVFTDARVEATVDRGKEDKSVQKGLHEYQELMRACFSEYYRVLKPGRWMTVVFSNSKNAVWRAIQEALGTAGFVVADVRTLDKQQGSFKQVTSSAVKQDLVISAYKPTQRLLEEYELAQVSEPAVWSFVREHLSNVPVFVGQTGAGEIVAERTPQMLLDRMIAFHVQRGVAVPISAPDFYKGLAEHLPERDGMYFLPEQVAEYDKKRMRVQELKQLELFVTDEASAVQWVRQQLQVKPRTLQNLTPEFLKELQAWAKHEQTVELREILEQSFLRYDGTGPVPNQIHAYLSSNFKDLRNLDKENPQLQSKARHRWYVPDPGKQADLEKLREKTLLKEFEEYKGTKQKRFKQFRTEAVRAGFKACYDEADYATIVQVAEKLPESVLQEDEKLLMYYDVASMRLGND